MKQKNYIVIFFILIFTISTTGLPLALHYCKMMGSATLDSCSDCIEETTSCCNVKYDKVLIKSAKDLNCCETVLIAQPLDEDFVNSKTELPKLQIDILYHSSIVPGSRTLAESIKTLSVSHSPPLIAEEIYLFNSTFLI